MTPGATACRGLGYVIVDLLRLMAQRPFALVAQLGRGGRLKICTVWVRPPPGARSQRRTARNRVSQTARGPSADGQSSGRVERAINTIVPVRESRGDRNAMATSEKMT